MLKKLIDKKVAAEELKKVAGGTLEETSNDSKFLSKLNGDCDRYGTAKISWFSKVREEIGDAWEKVGVHVDMFDDKPNRYYIIDEEVSREKAMQHAQDLERRYLDPKEWNW